MKLEEAKSVLMGLANGINPVTGELFPEDSPYNDPKIIRALFTIAQFINEAKQQKKSPSERQQDNVEAGRPRNAGMPWTESLKSELVMRFQAGASLAELAQYFERTHGAITSELEKQGYLEQKNVV